MGGIYAIEHIASGKKYVGSTVDFKSRKKQHFSDLRNKRHFNRYLQNSFNKYGENEFQWIILEDCCDNELLVKEEGWISECGVFNFSHCPMAPMRGRKHSPETLKLMGKKGSEHPNSKINEELVHSIFNFYEEGLNQKQIAKVAGIHHTNVSLILRGKAWSHVGREPIKGRTNNTSGCVGVYYDKDHKKWVAEMIRSGKWNCLGRFNKKEDAIVARKKAEKEVF